MNDQDIAKEAAKKAPKSKFSVRDAHELDKRVPRDLIIKYQDKYFILKAGLEWKAMQLYGGGNFSLILEIIENDREKDYYLAKAMFQVRDGATFINFGEATKKNVSNPKMLGQMIHLALTRAECRVLRMATASGYASYEEMDFVKGEKEMPELENENEPAKDGQLKMIKDMGGDPTKFKTYGEAAREIKRLATPEKKEVKS